MNPREASLRWQSYGLALSKRLRKLRVMRGISQERLAELSGVSRNEISYLERNETSTGKAGDPKLSTVYRLARALAVPPAAMLPGPGDQVAEHFPAPESAAQDLSVDVRWPMSEQDTVTFRELHLSSRVAIDVQEGASIDEIARQMFPGRRQVGQG